MISVFTTAGQIVTGWGSRARLGQLAAGFGRRALLVTGRSALRASGAAGQLRDILAAAGVAVTEFAEVEPEPAVETVDRGRAAAAAAGCELVLAAGGGSALDVGKAVAALARAAGPTARYFDAPVTSEKLPCIAVPTTAGTGAEVTPNSVLTAKAEPGTATAEPGTGENKSLRVPGSGFPVPVPVKQSLRGWTLLPDVALVDPELTVHCSPAVTAAAGMDALTQAIESYWSRGASPLTDALALRAAELVWRNLLVAYQTGDDQPAREALAYGALLAGMALANARLGAAHGLAHPLGCLYHVGHGQVCAALLPHVMRFNQEAAGEKYDTLSDLFAFDAADGVSSLLGQLDLPTQLPVRPEDHEYLIRQALLSGSTQANPRAVTAEDVRELLGRVTKA